MNITLSKQTIITIFKSLISSSNYLQQQINLENNPNIKAILEHELAEVDEALELFEESVKDYI